MADTYTTNLNLIKPGYDSAADIADINGNMDKIDAAYKTVDAIRLGGHEASEYARTVNKVSPDENGNVQLDAEDVGALSSDPDEGTETPEMASVPINADLLGGNPSEYYFSLYNLQGAGAHNAIYRGQDLGTSVTDEQYAAIAAGTFDNLFVGDYWAISGVTYRIAAFDYYYRAGDPECTMHHVTLVPDENMYTHVMNDTNVATGAYIGSKMYTEGLTQAKNTINSAFGSSHVLNHRQYLQNAVTNDYASGGSWYDSTVELMTEQNVYGCKIFGNMLNGTALPNSYTVDKSQYPLFKFRPDMISNRQWFWLRDVVSAARFAGVAGYGLADCYDASGTAGVRPAFSIIG